MKILAIDTTGTVASVALVDDEKTIGEMTADFKRNHSQTLMPMVQRVLDMVETELSEVDYIGCASGPGSFTGLRIGAATAKALAYAANKPIVAVPTLDALAYNVFSIGQIVTPMMDARRGQVYAAFYRWENGKLVRLSPYMAEDVDEILRKSKLYQEEKTFIGDGVPVYLEQIKSSGVAYVLPPQCMQKQRASSVGSLGLVMAREGKLHSDLDFLPFYIRKPQAEREYEEKRQQ